MPVIRCPIRTESGNCHQRSSRRIPAEQDQQAESRYAGDGSRHNQYERSGSRIEFSAPGNRSYRSHQVDGLFEGLGNGQDPAVLGARHTVNGNPVRRHPTQAGKSLLLVEQGELPRGPGQELKEFPGPIFIMVRHVGLPFFPFPNKIYQNAKNSIKFTRIIGIKFQKASFFLKYFSTPGNPPWTPLEAQGRAPEARSCPARPEGRSSGPCFRGPRPGRRRRSPLIWPVDPGGPGAP